MRTTLRQAKDSSIPKVLEMDPEDPRVVVYINEAQLRLLNRAKDGWWDTFARMRFCIGSDGCITWPRHIAAIKNIALCSEAIRPYNQWYEFMGDGSGLADYCNCNYGPAMFDRGSAPTFDDILPSSSNTNNKKVRLYPSLSSDVGKRILIQGTDVNNLPIRTLDGSDYVDGFYMTLASPYVDSSIIVSSISAVQKPITNGDVRAFELDTDSSGLRAIAIWGHDETNPWYRRSYVNGLTCYNSSCCSSRTATVMAKLAYYPARVDTDWLVIGNLAALKDMVQSIRKREANLSQEARESEANAIRELNHELRAHGMEPSVNISVYGSAHLRKRRIGKLI